MTFCLPGTDRGRGVPIPFCACVLHLKQEQYVFRFTNAWNSSAWGKKKFTIRPQAVLFCFVVFYFFWSGNYPPPSVYLGRQNVIHMIKWSRPTLSVRNVIGRENLITSGQTNEFTQVFHCESFMADRTRLGNTTLDYMAVQQAMWEHLERTFKNHAKLLGKLTAVYLENGFQGTIKHQSSPFLVLLKSSLPLLFEKKNPARTGSY